MIAQATEDQVKRFRAVVADRIGLRFENSKLGMLADLLHRRSEIPRLQPPYINTSHVPHAP